MRTTRRPMRAAERARVEALATWRPRLAAAVGPTSPAIIIVLIVWGLFVTRLLADPYSRDTANIGFILVCLIPFAALLFSIMWSRESALARRIAAQRRARYAPDLEANEMEEWEVGVLDAMEIEDATEEGPNFYVELEDGRVLFLHGLYLTEDVNAKRFPNRVLHITRLPHAGDIFDLQCRGEYLEPSYFRGMFLAEEMEAGTVPEDGQILPGPLDTYKFDPNDDESSA
jgi:hypothetical protein